MDNTQTYQKVLEQVAVDYRNADVTHEQDLVEVRKFAGTPEYLVRLQAADEKWCATRAVIREALCNTKKELGL